MGTLELLLTAPITEWDVVLGKFFASFAFLIIMMLLSFTFPAILFYVGNPDWGAVIGGYFGTFFLGASYLVIGLWISSFTDSQIIAFIISVFVIFILLVIGETFVLQTLPDVLVPIAKYISLGAHFKSILRGVLDSRDIIYYLLVTFLFLYLNVVGLKSRKWH